MSAPAPWATPRHQPEQASKHSDMALKFGATASRLPCCEFFNVQLTLRRGLCRPSLVNIFLRDALYTSYLRDEFQLQKSEAYLEVPLDSISAGRIYKKTTRGELPRWPGVKHNTPEVSILYQAVASTLALHAGVARVHLDTYWWGERGIAD